MAPPRPGVESLGAFERARYRRDYVERHERYRAGDEIRLPRRYPVTLGRRRPV
jgi:hypothetical protein